MKTFFRVFSIILLVSWMGLIFYFSHQTATESSIVSGSVIEFLAEKFHPDFISLSELEKQELISSLQHIVRSVAHYCVYGGLGFFAYLTFVSYVKLKYKTRVFWMLFVSVLYAVSDEIHQYFIDGRSFQYIDIAVDFGGAVTAILICSLFVAIIGPLRRRVRYEASGAPDCQAIPKLEYKEYDFPEILLEETDNICEQESVSVCEKANTYEEKAMENNFVKTKREEPKKEDAKQPIISQEFEYASGIIGKTVVEATRVCNGLGAINDCDKKELVNLVLGRTEVLKAEVLKILNSDNDFEQKKDLMQKEQESAYDYFDSIKAQMG